MFNKTYFKNLKKKLISLCIALGLLTSAFYGLFVGNYTKEVYAYSSDPSASSTYFSDPNFKQGGTTPTYWKVIEGQGNYNSDRMVGGIFDSETTTDSYLIKYKVFENPGVPTSEKLNSNDDLYNSLVLSAPYPAGANFGFKPSTSKLDLKKNSFYAINITLKTASIDDTTNSALYKDDSNVDKRVYASSIESKASVYISGFSNEETDKIAKFEMIEGTSSNKRTDNGWGTFTFYIATNQLTAETGLDFEVWLGSKTDVSTGNVFFNNVTVEQFDNNTFNNLTKNLSSSAKLIDLRDKNVDETPIANANFDSVNLYSGWKVVAQDANVSDIESIDTSSFQKSDLFNKYDLSAEDLSDTNMRSKDTKALFMANSEDSYTAIESIENFTFERQRYYKLSVWAWSNSKKSTGYISLVDSTDNDDITMSDANLTVSSTATKSDATNGWVEYSFYIYGHKFLDTTAKLRLSIGSETTNGSGYAYFDNVTLQEITYKQFSDNSSASNSTTFNYNKTNDAYTIANYSFDITENETINNSYPLAPATWTYSYKETADKSLINGVVNTHSTLFNADKLRINGSTAPSNPGKLPYQEEDAYNNVLMMGSRYVSTQSYTSQTFNLNANSYYKLSMYVNAPMGSAKIKVSNAIATIYEQSDITSYAWTEFVTYIKTGTKEDSVTIELSLDNTSVNTKFAFFDEVVLNESSQTIFEEINASVPTTIYTGTHISKVDLQNYDFENNAGSLNGFEESGVKKGETYARIENTNEEHSIIAHSGNNALVIYCSDNINKVNYFATTKRSYTLSASSYYKISVFVLTRSISEGGATVTLSGTGLDKSFYNIDTETLNNNEWTEYSFYVNAKSETTATLQLGLGNSTTKSSGYAMFDDITIEKLDVSDDEAFETLTSSLNSQNNQTILVESTEEEDNKEEASEEETFKGSFNWYLATSLITALAIIIAVVGTLLRKINFKRPKKVKTPYDRRKTLDVSLDKKERIARRQEEIKVLEQQLKEIEDEIAGIKREVEVEQQEFNEEHDKAKAVIEERRSAIIKEKEHALHERNEKIAKDKNAFTREEEEKFAEYIKKLEKQELKETQQIAKHDKAINNFKTKHSLRLEKVIARKEFIKAEIQRIDAEIEAIAKEEAQIWEEYKQAKADAKKRKAEYKASLKEQKNKSANNMEESEKEELKETEVEIIKPDEDKSE